MPRDKSELDNGGGVTSEPTSIAQLPTGWTRTTIEEIFAPLDDGRTLHQGWSPQCERTPSLSDKEWGVLKTTSIQAGTFLPEHNKLLPKNRTPRPTIEVRPGDLLITCAGPRARCGVACLVRNTRPRLMMSGKMYRFRLPEKYIESRFVEAYLQTTTAHDAIDRMKTGGSDSGLNLTHDRFRTLSIPLAPIKEQKRIVAKLEELCTKLDAGVKALRMVQVQLERYRQSVLKAAVNGELTREWREAHQDELEPASNLLERILRERRAKWEANQLSKMKAAGKTPANDFWKAKYKQPAIPTNKELGQLPQSWTWATAEQLNPYDRPCAYGVLQPGDDVRNGVPFVRVGDIGEGRINTSNMKRIAQKIAEAYPRTRLFGQEVLITLVGAIGRTAVVPTSLAGANTARAVGVIPICENISSRWTEIWFRNPSKIQEMTNLSHEVARKTLNLEDVRTALVALPSFSEQHMIVNETDRLLSVTDNIGRTIVHGLKEAERLRQSILKRAFEGKLASQDPEEEPAERLLERIKIKRAEREAEKPPTLKRNQGPFKGKLRKRIEGAAA